MSEQQLSDFRRRIRELLAIPDRDRTDEQWDELIELEIRTAPGNRESTGGAERHFEKRPVSSTTRRQNSGQKGNAALRTERTPQEARQEARLPKRQHRRPKRPPQQQADAASGGNANSSANGNGNDSGNNNNVDGSEGQ